MIQRVKGWIRRKLLKVTDTPYECYWRDRAFAAERKREVFPKEGTCFKGGINSFPKGARPEPPKPQPPKPQPPAHPKFFEFLD